LRFQTGHRLRRVFVLILIEHREIINAEDFATKIARGKIHKRSRQLEIDRVLPIAPNNNADFSDRHECLLLSVLTMVFMHDGVPTATCNERTVPAGRRWCGGVLLRSVRGGRVELGPDHHDSHRQPDPKHKADHGAD
jgi:hypothetical protein